MTIISFLRKRGAGLACVLAGMAAPAYAADNDAAAIERGKAAAMVCVACHQADGNGLDSGAATPWPRLAGLDAVYLARQLQAFKTGDRQSAEMAPFANMLNEEQIRDVALYYQSLEAKAPPSAGDTAPEMLAAGEQLALTGDWDRYIVPCISCHGPGNQGVGHVFPDIAGQHPRYIAQQLVAWQQGERKGDPLGLMHAIAQRMTDDDIQAVSVWLGTQPPAGAAEDSDNTTEDAGATQ